MELQDRVTVTLTEHGAKILNKISKELNDRCKNVKPFKTDHKKGDLLTSELYDIISIFKDHFGPGCYICFTNIIPEIKGIEVDALRFWEHINSENTKKEEDKRLGVFAKEGSFRFNGFLFALDTLEKFSCPIISTDHMIVKLDKREEFVSIESYEMLGNAYKEAIDECTRLKYKLARIQELIKE